MLVGAQACTSIKCIDDLPLTGTASISCHGETHVNSICPTNMKLSQ